MNWVDSTTAILSDTSILNFHDDGKVNMFPSKEWRKPKTKQYNRDRYVTYQYQDKTTAIKIWEEVDSILLTQKTHGRRIK